MRKDSPDALPAPIRSVANDGYVYLPNGACGGKAGVGVSSDNNKSWKVYTIPDSQSGGGAFLPPGTCRHPIMRCVQL